MWHFDNFSISKREILVSIAIIAILLIIGFMIAGAIENAVMLEQQEYNLAIHIDNNKDLFQYGMQTNVGNAFVYGELKCLDPVTYDEIGGQYSYVKKVKERYTQHTRVVTYTVTVNGKSQVRTRTETYWTWDPIDRWSKSSTKISFVGVEFPYGTIDFPGSTHIDTIKESPTIRYVYYGAPIQSEGTIYAELGNNTISDVSFHSGMTTQEAYESYITEWQLIVFWICWSLLIIGAVFVFIYIDNRWLEDRRSRW